MRAPLLGNPKNEVFNRCVKFPVDGYLFYRGPFGEPGSGLSAGTFERKGII